MGIWMAGSAVHPVWQRLSAMDVYQQNFQTCLISMMSVHRSVMLLLELLQENRLLLYSQRSFVVIVVAAVAHLDALLLRLWGLLLRLELTEI